MHKLLVIDSSARSEGSVSRQLTQALLSHWQAIDPQAQVTYRDLGRHPVAHLDHELLGGWMTPAKAQTQAQQQALTRSDKLTDELKAADVLVLSMPMYNFAIPSTLKAWLDHVLRAGVTFKYTETGPVGLLTGKRAVVLTARGGVYAGTDLDHQSAYLRQVLNFIGIEQIDFIHAEGQNLGAEAAEAGLNQALEAIGALR